MELTNKAQRGWSKWGGPRKGIFRKETIFAKEWYCQWCGKLVSNLMPRYFMEISKGSNEFIQICSCCKNKANRQGTETHDQRP